MRIRPFVLPAVAATLVLSGPLLGYEAGTHAGAPPKARHVYRLDYTLAITEPGKAAAMSAFVVNVEEGAHGDTSAGANIPLVTAGSQAGPRQDVGTRIHSDVTRAGNDLILHDSLEISRPGEPLGALGATPIHKMTANGDVVLALGKPALVAGIEEPVSHVRYELTATATKLR
jgi:hypothetical protein